MTIDLATITLWIGGILAFVAMLGVVDAVRQALLAKAGELDARQQQILHHAGLLEAEDSGG